MKFFLTSDTGALVWLAHRLQRDGHDVIQYTYSPQQAAKAIGRGMVPQAASAVPPADHVVLFGEPGHQLAAAGAIRRNLPVIGGGVAALDLNAMRASGLPLVETHSFATASDARVYLGTHAGGEWTVESPDGAVAVHGPAEALMRWLRWAPLAGTRLWCRRLPTDCVTISLLGWFDGTRLVPPAALVQHTDDVVLVRPLLDAAHPLAERVSRLRRALTTAQHIGPFLVRFAVTPTEVLALDCRLDAGTVLPAWSFLMEDDLGIQLEAFARGSLQRFSARMDGTALAMRLTVDLPPPLAGFPLPPSLLRPRWFLPGAMAVDDGPRLTGFSNAVGWVGGADSDLWALQATAVDRAAKLGIVGLRYATALPSIDFEEVMRRTSPRGEAPGRMGYAADTDVTPSAPPPAPIVEDV